MNTATQILANVDGQRLQKAVEGLVSGAYTITVAQQDEDEIRGFVVNGDGKEYGVLLYKGHGFCGCKDAIYRKTVCKHQVAVALYTIRHPREGQPSGERPLDLRLGKTRPGFAFSA